MNASTGPLRVAISTSSFGSANNAPLDLLRSHIDDVVENPYGRRLTEDEAILHLKGVHGLIAGVEPLTERVLEAAPDLRAIARVGIGMDSVDVEAAEGLGIRVSNTPDAPGAAVAELALTAALVLLRGVVEKNAALHEGRWEKSVGRTLIGANVLIIGYGRIGRRFAELVRCCGAEVRVVDPYLEADTADEPLCEASEGLPWADVVSIHAGGGGTVIGADELALMRDNAILLNSARGASVDEAALLFALDAGRFAGVWLDVFSEEPYEGPLSKYARVLMTPHVGTYTDRCRLEMEMGAVRNLLRDLEVAQEATRTSTS